MTHDPLCPWSERFVNAQEEAIAAIDALREKQ
jgi:hypothetical protein